jgi:hypothetical protein
MRMNELQQKRAAKYDAARAINDKAERENRALGESERQELRALMTEIESIDADVEARARLDRLERSAPAKYPTDRRADGTLEGYSLTKALFEFADGRQLTGLEAEHDQELRIWRGKSTRGFLVPLEVILPRREQRLGAGQFVGLRRRDHDTAHPVLRIQADSLDPQ